MSELVTIDRLWPSSDVTQLLLESAAQVTDYVLISKAPASSTEEICCSCQTQSCPPVAARS